MIVRFQFQNRKFQNIESSDRLQSYIFSFRLRTYIYYPHSIYVHASEDNVLQGPWSGNGWMFHPLHFAAMLRLVFELIFETIGI